MQILEAGDRVIQPVRWYGKDAGKTVKYAEVFEICEYGRRPNEKEIRRLFPFFPKP